MSNTSPAGRMTLNRWRELTEWPLTIAALAFISVYAWQVLADPGPLLGSAAAAMMWTIWAVFAFDYVVSLSLAPKRWRWFFTHFHELLIVVLPVLRPLRLLRLVTLLSVLQRAAGSTLRGKVLLYAVGSSVLLVGVAALAMLDVERNAPGATITTFGDALWWAVVTITTVGYGDVSPVSNPGRFIAVGIMIAGIALLGTVTAMLAAWLLDRVETVEEEAQLVTRQELADLVQEIGQLRELLVAERGATSPWPFSPVTGYLSRERKSDCTGRSGRRSSQFTFFQCS